MFHSMYTFKDFLTMFYYTGGALGLLFALIRILYGWFRDYDNATRFTADMALVHLPYIHKTLQDIATHMGAKIEPPPPVNFSSKPQA